jgi:hypothetical protein
VHTEVGSEAELRRQFEAVVGRVTAPTAELVRSGLAHGQRLRRRRGTVVASVAVAVLILAGASGVLLGLGSGPEPAPTVTPAAPPEPRVPITPRSMAAILASMMPRTGTISGFSGYPPEESVGELDVWPHAGLTYDDGRGSVTVEAAFGPHNEHEPEPCPGNLPYQVSCTEERLPDGSQLTIADYAGFAKPGPGETWRWPVVERAATLVRADGRLVTVNVRNDVAPRGFGPPTRPDLPLTGKQLAAIVQSPVWQDTVPISIAQAGQRLKPYRVG